MSTELQQEMVMHKLFGFGLFFFFTFYFISVCYDFVFIQHNTVESRVSKTNVFFLLFFLNGVFGAAGMD